MAYETPDVTLSQLKKPRWAWQTGDKNYYALDYNIGGQKYMFINEDYILKGIQSSGKQYVNANFLKDGALESIYNNGLLVDLAGVAPKSYLNNFKKAGLGTKGVLVSQNVLQDSGLLSNNKFTGGKVYTIDNSRTGGEVLGLTQADGNFVYAQAPQGDRAGATFFKEDGKTYANYTKIRGGWLGKSLVNIAEEFAQIPLAPELISAVTGGNPAVYASLKGLQTAGGGGEVADVLKSGLKGYVASGGLEGSNLSAAEIKTIKTLTASMDTNNPLEAFVKSYGTDAISDVISDAEFANVGAQNLSGVIGEDAATWLSNNSDALVGVGKDILINEKTPMDAITRQFGEKIATGLGAESTNEKALAWAGMKTAVGLDQGLDTQNALIAGAEEYYQRGGRLSVPEFQKTLSEYGINLPQFNIDRPNIKSLFPDWNWPVDVDLDKELFAGDFDLGFDFPKGGIDVNIPKGGLDFDVPEVGLDVDVPEVGLDVPEVGLDVPEVSGPSVPEVSGPNIPEIPAVDLALALQRRTRTTADDEEEDKKDQGLLQYVFSELKPVGQIDPVLPVINIT